MCVGYNQNHLAKILKITIFMTGDLNIVGVHEMFGF